MATIFTKEVIDVHLEHILGHTPARLKAFSRLFVKKSLAGKGPICEALEYQSANFENWQIGTRAWWTRVRCEVRESTKLGYQLVFKNS